MSGIKINKIVGCILLISLTTFSLKSFAQTKTNILELIDNYQKNFPKEKLYLSFDRPYYNSGDTIWFKSVLLKGNLKQIEQTDRIYIELFNDSTELVERRVIILNNGLGYGDIALKKDLPEGNYMIRAYSNWQQNFGTSYFFQKNFYIGGSDGNSWMVSSAQNVTFIGAKGTLELTALITGTKGEPVALKDVDLYLMNGTKPVTKAIYQTSLLGGLALKIPFSANQVTNKNSLLIIDKKNPQRKTRIPVILKDNKIDIQFMPEGGYLINGINTRVAYKAIGADGLGQNIIGKVVNEKNETVAETSLLHKGMGSFFLFPKLGEKYTFVYQYDGIRGEIELPNAQAEGTSLRIDHLSKPDTVLIYLRASESKRLDNNYKFIAQLDGKVILSTAINLKAGFSNIQIPKKDFPDGIIHFTLFSPEQIPLNERQAFINNRKKINLVISTQEASYGLRDSIALSVKATTEDGTALSGSFALSVTDDSRVYKENSEESIASYFLLQSNLKGNIEDAQWYFSEQYKPTRLALDNLMLTQGWVGYNWAKIVEDSNLPKFTHESGNVITGNLKRLFDKPANNFKVTLLAMGKNLFVADTVSDGNGNFEFRNLPYLDSTAYLVKIKNAKGRQTGVEINLNKFLPAKSPSNIGQKRAWYMRNDSFLVRTNKATMLIKSIKSREPNRIGINLKDVNITIQKKLERFRQETTKETTWDAAFYKKISEEELKEVPQKSLLDLLREKLPGLTVRRINNKNNFYIGNSLVAQVVIDNINTRQAVPDDDDPDKKSSKNLIEPESPYFQYLNQMFRQLNASDISEINVYYGGAIIKSGSYYLDITTRSGNGPWINTSYGVNVYRPLPVYRPREFYNPKYRVNKEIGNDFRSTIFWEANLVTDRNGIGKVSFYSADLPGSYTIKVEGTDLDGRFGFETSSIKITAEKPTN